MNWKLAGLALCAVSALGACSGDGAAVSGDGEAVEDGHVEALLSAETAYSVAVDAVARAQDEVRTAVAANTDAARSKARTMIADAREKLREAVEAAKTAVVAARGKGEAAINSAAEIKARADALLVSQSLVLDGAEGPVSATDPEDEEQQYLNLAGYGMFLHAADSKVPVAPFGIGRVQSMRFGYDAFGDAAGRRNWNIDKTIASATLLGRTVANPYPTDSFGVYRGDTRIMANPPNSVGAGGLTGPTSDFPEWVGADPYWNDYPDFNAGVSFLNLDGPTAIGPNGFGGANSRVTEAPGIDDSAYQGRN